MYVKSTPHGQFDLGHGDAAGQRGHAPENQRFGGDLAEGNPKGAQAGARALKVLQGNLGELPVA